METTLGGDRLGSGKKQKIHLHNYERSSHDLSYKWRSTMSAGTIVPFMREVALPGDSHTINLDCDVKTHPTIGPLFGSYKVQLDVFTVPIRLYNGKLHMNMLGIGMDMKNVHLPYVRMLADPITTTTEVLDLDNRQINPSSIFSYLGIRGLGTNNVTTQSIFRDFNAISWLAYWDIYKNYYANKQEEIGAVIHNNLIENDLTVGTVQLIGQTSTLVIEYRTHPGDPGESVIDNTTVLRVEFEDYEDYNPDTLIIWLNGTPYNATQVFANYQLNLDEGWLQYTGAYSNFINQNYQVGGYYFTNGSWTIADTPPKVTTFPLENIDQMRMDILTSVESDAGFQIDEHTYAPYGLALKRENIALNYHLYSKQSNQEGLALKTYQSDLFNNWISTEWIDGDNGINAITAIDTSGGSITIDEINLSNKIYNMLNRIALSGGTYDDWLDAVYTHDRVKSIESPVYVGGLSKELVFQEVVSTAQAGEESQPLGTLAGRGVLANKHKGGHIEIRTSEPSYIIGLVSLTPRLDYSQGNKWDVNLKTMDDFHKPALDEIGFQDLITDQMAWWDTRIDPAQGQVIYKSAGKQPAWINYMTNVNEVRGNFAVQNDQMFMVLNRRYEAQWNENQTSAEIKDLTTYIDPAKFNNIFADTRLDAQNFWTQIAVDIFARRKMSARIIPNL